MPGSSGLSFLGCASAASELCYWWWSRSRSDSGCRPAKSFFDGSAGRRTISWSCTSWGSWWERSEAQRHELKSIRNCAHDTTSASLLYWSYSQLECGGPQCSCSHSHAWWCWCSFWWYHLSLQRCSQSGEVKIQIAARRRFSSWRTAKQDIFKEFRRWSRQSTDLQRRDRESQR